MRSRAVRSGPVRTEEQFAGLARGADSRGGLAPVRAEEQIRGARSGSREQIRGARSGSRGGADSRARLHVYIRKYVHTYIHIHYIVNYILHTFIPTYVQTYLHTYIVCMQHEQSAQIWVDKGRQREAT